MSKLRRKRRRYSEEFKRLAVERMRECESVVGLAEELRVPWRQLYRWKAAMEEADALAAAAAAPPGGDGSSQQQVGRLKEALADQILQTQFFKGALQKIEARRQSNNAAGKTASTTKSGR